MTIRPIKSRMNGVNYRLNYNDWVDFEGRKAYRMIAINDINTKLGVVKEGTIGGYADEKTSMEYAWVTPGSIVINSKISSSTLYRCIVVDSNITYCDMQESLINNSDVSNSIIKDSFITDNSTIAKSEIKHFSIEKSVIDRSILDSICPMMCELWTENNRSVGFSFDHENSALIYNSNISMCNFAEYRGPKCDIKQPDNLKWYIRLCKLFNCLSYVTSPVELMGVITRDLDISDFKIFNRNISDDGVLLNSDIISHMIKVDTGVAIPPVIDLDYIPPVK